MTNGKRIEYIDYLKGLTIIWVVWYHTPHPDIASLGFRMPLFFFVSGIFFKLDLPMVYLKKKLNQLVVPFLFFTLVYLVFHLALRYRFYGTLSLDDLRPLGDIFRQHTGNRGITINPPLWFILALIDLQVVTWLLMWVFRRRRLLVAAAVIAIWWWDAFSYFFTPNYFMLGRALIYLPYFAFGNLFGRDFLGVVEGGGRRRFVPLVAVIALDVVMYLLPQTLMPHFIEIHEMVNTFAIIVFLVYLFKAIYRVRLLRPLVYYGKNSYIVLGLHEILLTIFTFALGFVADTRSPLTGGIVTILVLLALWPLIHLLNRYLPRLSGKAPLFHFKELSGKSCRDDEKKHE